MYSFTVTERPKNTSSAETDGQESSRDSTRRFHIVVNGDPTGCNADIVRASAPLPVAGMPHPNDSGLFCRGTVVEQISQLFYEGEAEYFAPNSGSSPNDSPTLQPAILRWSHVSSDEEIDQTADNKPILTVTGETFDPPIRRQFGDLQLTVERNVLYFDPILATDYLFTVNSDNFLGFSPGTVLCTQFSADSVSENPQFVYWRRTIAFQFRRGAPNTTDARAWYRRIRAEGYYINDPARLAGLGDPAKPRFRALDSDGQPTVKPVLHTVNRGHYVPDPVNAEWYEFQVYQAKPFLLLLSL